MISLGHLLFFNQVDEKQEKYSHPQIVAGTTQPQEDILEPRHHKEHQDECHRHDAVILFLIA